jgi:peptidoglycan/xylan/chitin deacetylase (PgdA/CDA1 family)
VPIPNQFLNQAENFKEDRYREWAKIINSYPWLEVGIHGFMHDKGEMDVDYDKANRIIESAEKMLDRVGLKYKKIFVAPYWQYSWWALKALRDKGYIVGLNSNHPIQTPKGTKTYYYNWSLEETDLPPTNIIKGHGHMYKGNHLNTLEDIYHNILKSIPKEAEFKFISEL